MRVSVVCIAIVTGTCVAVTCDVARAQPDRIDTIRTPPSSALTEFWTPQQLQDAQPMPLPVVDPSTLGPTDPAEPYSGASRSGAAKGPRNQDSGVSGNASMEPLSRAGKLFFNKGGKGWVCSAQFIAPGILITAAHCVRDDVTGQWYTNILYKHGYFRGQGISFSSQCALTYNGWVSRDETKKWVWDYAMIKVRGGTDQGYFGWQYGWWGQYSTAPKIGYPVDIEQGQVIQVEFGRLIKGYQRGLVGLNHGNPRSGGGSSGGAWVGRYGQTGNPQSNYIISVTSHSINGNDSIDYGPYWDNNMESLMNSAKRCS